MNKIVNTHASAFKQNVINNAAFCQCSVVFVLHVTDAMHKFTLTPSFVFNFLSKVFLLVIVSFGEGGEGHILNPDSCK